jgi:CBS domain-containing protein
MGLAMLHSTRDQLQDHRASSRSAPSARAVKERFSRPLPGAAPALRVRHCRVANGRTGRLCLPARGCLAATLSRPAIGFASDRLLTSPEQSLARRMLSAPMLSVAMTPMPEVWKMRCDEIMKRNIECVSPMDTVQSAAKRMRAENLGFLPVCDKSRKVLGTVTDRDIALRIVADARPASATVEEVMTREVVSCRPEDDLQQAEEIMAQHRKSRIMCLDRDDRLVGVISLSDIAQNADGMRAARALQRISEREIRA